MISLKIGNQCFSHYILSKLILSFRGFSYFISLYPYMIIEIYIAFILGNNSYKCYFIFI